MNGSTKRNDAVGDCAGILKQVFGQHEEKHNGGRGPSPAA
jgi:hypothetical protein